MPFRLAKLTACRKVRGMYRRYRAKSSRYGHESAMLQAFPRGRTLGRLHALGADDADRVRRGEKLNEGSRCGTAGGFWRETG